MANEFTIRQLVATAHGYVGLPFPQLGLENYNPFPKVERLGKAIFSRNKLGKPLFMDVIIDGVQMPNETLITITTRKLIEETVLVGNDHRGTVKEFISAGDYMIKIQGVCIDPDNPKEYPEEQVESIIALCEKHQALDFDNDFARLFNINRIVIKDYGFGDMKGKPYSQSYYINAVSDDDFYAIIDDQNKNLTGL